MKIAFVFVTSQTNLSDAASSVNVATRDQSQHNRSSLGTSQGMSMYICIYKSPIHGACESLVARSFQYINVSTTRRRQ